MDKQQNATLKNLTSDYVDQCALTYRMAINESYQFNANPHKKRHIRDQLVHYIDSLTVLEESTPTDDFFSQYTSPWTSQKYTFFPESIRKLLQENENERNGA